MWIKGSTPLLCKEKIKRILLIQLGDIGDVVLSFPCIRALKEQFPDAQVLAAVRDKAKDLLDACPWADDVIPIEQTDLSISGTILYQFRFLKRLRAFRFDLVFDLRAGTRGAILARLSGATLRIGFHSAKETFWRNRMFTHLKAYKYDPNLHQSTHYQSLLNQCGIRATQPHPKIILSEEHNQKARLLMERHCINLDKQLIAIHPFALWRYKEWPLEKTTELVKHLTKSIDRKILILGAPAEKSRAQQIVDQCKNKPANLAGETTLSVLAAVINYCMLMIGMDSAVGHISAAVSTPCITIFGPGKPSVWAPIGASNRIVQSDLPCIHCGQKGCNGKEYSLCLEELSIDKVLSTVNQHIDFLSNAYSEKHITKAGCK